MRLLHRTLHRRGRRDHGLSAYLLEWEFDGDLSTGPGDADSIGLRLRQFGPNTSYCCLFDTRDESCIWCWGEPDRRIVEIRRCLVGGNAVGVIARCYADPATTRIWANSGEGYTPHEHTVARDEVLTLDEALALFSGFRSGDHALPAGYRLRPHRYFAN